MMGLWTSPYAGQAAERNAAAACSTSSAGRSSRQPCSGSRSGMMLHSHRRRSGAPHKHIAECSDQAWCSHVSSRRALRPVCAVKDASKAAASQGTASPREAHKIFDEVVITVKSGDGGNGEIVEAGKGKNVKNFKYRPGGNQAKEIWLEASNPAEGADGADVVFVCDPMCDSLLHLHKRKLYSAPRGANGNPAVGSAGPKRNREVKKAFTPPYEIPVPPGTVVKRNKGQVLGELIQPGSRLLVAAGGRGGAGVRAPSHTQRISDTRRELKAAREAGGEVIAIEDGNWREDAKGLPGRQMSLQLLLRVVADVGIVGFPNAGKSSLLAALTRASPEVAPYPFTTLMPNLGVMQSGGAAEAEAGAQAAAGAAPVLADLPGLIEGAHQGRGLGRMFLRHLRRTRVLLHVVDASAPDPSTDYWAVREELRMYNPDYVTRPHVVALNKMDLEDAGELRSEVAHEVLAVAERLAAEHRASGIEVSQPTAVVACSAASGEGVTALAAALQDALRGEARQQRLVLHADAPDGEQQRGTPGEQQQDDGHDGEASSSYEEWLAGLSEEELAIIEASESMPSRPEDGDEGEEFEDWALAGNWEEAEEAADEGADEMAGPDDDDAWMLELTEEELLALERDD